MTMTRESSAPKRDTATYLIALVCMLTALMQLATALLIFQQADASGLLDSADGATRVRIFLPLVIAIFLHLAAGGAIYLMQVEALGFLGCLLGRVLARMIDRPFPLTLILDLSILLVLAWFSVRLFERSSSAAGAARSGWRHPLAMLFLGLMIGHLSVLLSDIPVYTVLVTNGSISPLRALGGLIGCVALYAAVAMMQSRPQRAQTLFLIAAFVLGLSISVPDYQRGFATPFSLGAAFALLGVGLARYLKPIIAVPGKTAA